MLDGFRKSPVRLNYSYVLINPYPYCKDMCLTTNYCTKFFVKGALIFLVNAVI